MDQKSPDGLAAAPKPRSARPKQSVESSVKDTIESILVAFMLAFIFRAFIVEAFVIPTGSMAPTLLGAHMRFRCADCGYRLDVNYPSRETQDGDIIIDSVAKGRTFAIFCPNCGYRLPRLDPADQDNDSSDPNIRYGDRILVLKYLYLFEAPQRWDVVVFKSPYDPNAHDYSQNYIKRLVGRPSENIMVLDGDVYVSTDPNTELSSFQVQTKPYTVQNALWRIVYDNDYAPRGLNRANLKSAHGEIIGSDSAWQQPWKHAAGETGWTTSQAGVPLREFTFSNLDGASTLFYDAQVNPNKHSFTDWLAYDVTVNQGSDKYSDTYANNSYEPGNNVSDIKLEFFYQRREGEGPLRVQLTKNSQAFEARFTPDGLTLLMNDEPIAGPVALPRTSNPLHVEVTNVDYRVSVRVDGQELLATTPQQYHPDLPGLMRAYRENIRMPKPAVRIIGDRQVATLGHVTLWRDVYYLNRGDRRSTREPYRTGPPWASPEDFPNNLARLGKDEYFVMGDNSFVSLDARFWNDSIDLPRENLHVLAGRVPQRFMLGKAFFVYWPAGYPPINAAPALAPDFGDMRFIH